MLAPRDIIGKLIRLIDALADAAKPSDIARLEELRASLWDAQIEEDAKSGALQNKFGAMAQEAAAQDSRGASTPLASETPGCPRFLAALRQTAGRYTKPCRQMFCVVGRKSAPSVIAS